MHPVQLVTEKQTGVSLPRGILERTITWWSMMALIYHFTIISLLYNTVLQVGEANNNK